MEITGKLIQKLSIQSGISKTGNNWQKQEFVIETIENYPKKICANLWGDSCASLERLNIGDNVVMAFNIESREFNGRWYTNINASRIDPIASGQQGYAAQATPQQQVNAAQPTPQQAYAAPQTQPAPQQPLPSAPQVEDTTEDDDLPF